MPQIEILSGGTRARALTWFEVNLENAAERSNARYRGRIVLKQSGQNHWEIVEVATHERGYSKRSRK